MADDVVKSVGRVITVLELFEAKRESLTGAQIASELGYPSSSTNAVLKSLVKLGYLSWNIETRKYFPTQSVSKLGDWIRDDLMANEAQIILESLHRSTGETVTLSTQNDLNMQFIRVLPGTFPISLSVRIGYLGPLFGSAIGMACLSRLNDDQIGRLLERGKRTPGNEFTKIQLSEVMEEVKVTRQRGYAVGYDRILPDTGAVAVPLPKQPNFVVGVGGLSPRIRRSEKEIVRTMLQAVRDADEALIEG